MNSADGDGTTIGGGREGKRVRPSVCNLSSNSNNSQAIKTTCERHAMSAASKERGYKSREPHNVRRVLRREGTTIYRGRGYNNHPKKRGYGNQPSERERVQQSAKGERETVQ